MICVGTGYRCIELGWCLWGGVGRVEQIIIKLLHTRTYKYTKVTITEALGWWWVGWLDEMKCKWGARHTCKAALHRLTATDCLWWRTAATTSLLTDGLLATKIVWLKQRVHGQWLIDWLFEVGMCRSAKLISRWGSLYNHKAKFGLIYYLEMNAIVAIFFKSMYLDEFDINS